MKIAPYTPASVAPVELDPGLVAGLDDATLLLALDAASAEDQAVLVTEIRSWRLEI